jgi:hypothetical protein
LADFEAMRAAGGDGSKIEDTEEIPSAAGYSRVTASDGQGDQSSPKRRSISDRTPLSPHAANVCRGSSSSSSTGEAPTAAGVGGSGRTAYGLSLSAAAEGEAMVKAVNDELAAKGVEFCWDL